MKLSISNIAWDGKMDSEVYRLMRTHGFSGLEIAPTRIFPEQPYKDLDRAIKWKQSLWKENGFTVCSMQSIWFGRKEKIFGSAQERESLLAYTKCAVDFAAGVGCRNLVFGCPRNRYMPDGADAELAVSFFRELGDYAAARGTVISMEANPVIYNTNYVTDTMSAIDLIRRVDSDGFRLNLDMGTMIWNQESPRELEGKISLVHHVHISEPELKPIKRRKIHQELFQVLEEENYQGFVSIEMGKTEDLKVIEDAMLYVRGIFA